MSENKKWYTAQQVADILQVNVATVRRWLRNGVINSSRIGYRKLRVSAEDLQEYLQSQSSGAKKDDAV